MDAGGVRFAAQQFGTKHAVSDAVTPICQRGQNARVPGASCLKCRAGSVSRDASRVGALPHGERERSETPLRPFGSLWLRYPASGYAFKAKQLIYPYKPSLHLNNTLTQFLHKILIWIY